MISQVHPIRDWGRRPADVTEPNRNSTQAHGLLGWWPVQSPVQRDYVGRTGQEFVFGTNIPIVPDRILGPTWAFNGAGWIVVEGGPNPAGSDVTMSFWVKTTSTAADVILGFYAIAGPNGGYGAGINITGANGFLNYWGGAGAAWVASSSVYNDGAWHLAGITVNGTAVTFYKNGVAAGTATSQQPTTHTAHRRIGSAAGGTNIFTGSLADIRVYDRALSAQEMWALYDPRTRWELYDTRPVPVWAVAGGGGGGGGGSTFPALTVAI